MNILTTGRARFIGSNFLFMTMEKYPDYRMICVDSLTYVGNLSTLEELFCVYYYIISISKAYFPLNIHNKQPKDSPPFAATPQPSFKLPKRLYF
ncbi:hypothetical protein SAMN05421659_11967 [[Clostridium] fimetarium]|uniref:dTDP-glucose 4,6-dehydratase n=1 Tax=[Clostridium] fimetarium TaxID=99656 RepID=A0A1I0RNB7_9FIRM|nr:hypothetical protein SAMN05421659_11967 [[Clostridium] fimetarium]